MNDQLIPVEVGQVGEAQIQTVNARDLHEFLEVQTAFKDWVARRIEEYAFEEGKDFCSKLSKSSGGRPAKDYHVSLDMAKELAMVEKTSKGREARRYFIECERRAKSAAAWTAPKHSMTPATSGAILGEMTGSASGLAAMLASLKQIADTLAARDADGAAVILAPMIHCAADEAARVERLNRTCRDMAVTGSLPRPPISAELREKKRKAAHARWEKERMKLVSKKDR